MSSGPLTVNEGVAPSTHLGRWRSGKVDTPKFVDFFCSIAWFLPIFPILCGISVMVLKHVGLLLSSALLIQAQHGTSSPASSTTATSTTSPKATLTPSSGGVPLFPFEEQQWSQASLVVNKILLLTRHGEKLFAT